MHTGSWHIPVQQLASALQASPSNFEKVYHFPRPAPTDVLIMQSRKQNRAAWAARLAQDAGFVNTLIYKQVTHVLLLVVQQCPDHLLLPSLGFCWSN